MTDFELQIQEVLDKNPYWSHVFWLRGGATETVQGIAAEIGAFQDEYFRRFGERPDPIALVKSDYKKGAVFFDPVTVDASLSFKVMIWRILIGCHILGVNFSYQRRGQSSLEITLRSFDGHLEPYHAEKWWDYHVLQHISIKAINNELFLGGFYPAVQAADSTIKSSAVEE
ncbi:MAG: hypothetical protein HY000_10965 [Planctomycetes bacterium]|nr:hypothetical protein [Planctomycetota bacterium]